MAKARAVGRGALGELDHHLSEAQNIAGRLSNMETRETDPALYRFGDGVWRDIERTRRELIRIARRARRA